MTDKSNQLFECKYCYKKYKRQSTLAVHQCEPKRRAKQEKEIGVQIGLRAWQRFYEMTEANPKKTYAEFAKSQFYSAFVKFGWYCQQIRAIRVPEFVDFLLKENVKLDWWTKDRYYEKFIFNYLRVEHPRAALERGIMEMDRWAKETGFEFNEFFIKAGNNKICQMISNGRISPWVVYNCSSGVQFLSSLTTEQTTIVFKWIDPEYWQKRFSEYYSDTKFVQSILKEAGMNI